jgi:hypothetical protein
MVLGNLGTAIRVTIPILIYFILFFGGLYAMFGSTQFAADWTPARGWGGSGAPPPAFWLFFVLAFLGGVIAFLWTATSWHRFILLEEMPGALGPALHPDAIGRYLLRILLIGVILIGLMMGLGIAGAAIGAALSAVLPPAALALLVGLIVYIPIVIIGYRLSPVLPAAATGAPLRLGEAWSATRGASGAILVLAVVSVIAGWALQQPVAVLNAAAPLLAVLAAIVVQWITSLVGISILTTLYGHFVERRDLNV